jgi:hypothetical protein
MQGDNMPLDGIVKFNIERQLTVFNKLAEEAMLEEELQELKDASTTHEVIDALCDLIVLSAGAMHKLGYDPTKALSETVKEISSRQGAFDKQSGKWKKDLNQDPKTLYTANYEIARY